MSTSNDDDGEGKKRSFQRSKMLMWIYLFFVGVLMSAYWFYSQAIRVIQSYDLDCAHPGRFYSEVWNFDFVILSLYGVLFIFYIMIGFSMMLDWANPVMFIVFLLYSVLVVGWMMGVAVYLSIQASSANTCSSVGNPFNDFRICGVCGTYPAWDGQCFNSAPYVPAVVGTLMINAPRAFQLAMTWVLVIVLVFGTIYLGYFYRKSQQPFINLVILKRGGAPRPPTDYPQQNTPQQNSPPQQSNPVPSAPPLESNLGKINIPIKVPGILESKSKIVDKRRGLLLKNN